ncbi:MAG: Asp-tRNA(Asn)/Glu-tRNA(Gln) amidotransferase subunit GatC [Terrimicrobiaceae bacterium]|nr:Asp-tRNA(Asn)/Glu-tRNA(Gln) amidotransferase subunit GatC [Terrimicrobiaceae bacterium]
MSPELDVRYVANLARIDLSEAEIAQFQSQLGRVLAYVEQLNQVDVSHVEPTAHANEIDNVFRSDETKPGLEKRAALANAPHSANGLVMVTKVVE